MIKRFLLLLLTTLPLAVNAQWRIGATGGFTYNMYTSDKHYLTDLHNEGHWGGTFGLACQYDLKEWKWCHSRIGVRADANAAWKAIHTTKGQGTNLEVPFTNNPLYIQLPIMANYSLGGNLFRAFLNIGGYGGWKIKGQENEWQRRFDFGGVGGLGAELNIRRLTFQAEARGYAGAISATKSDRKFKTPHYNMTLAFQVALFYNL